MQGIYLINFPDPAKGYVGQAVDLKKRWNEHKNRATNKNTRDYAYPIYHAIRKYGVENISFEVLEEVENRDLLNEREKYWFDTLSQTKNLYNVIDPLDGGATYFGYPLYQIEPKTLKIVAEYQTIKEAAQAMNCQHGMIRKVMLGDGITVRGYHWCLIKDWIPNWKPKERKIEFTKKAVAMLSRQTEEVLAVFPSLKEAVTTMFPDKTHNKCASSALSKVCRGVQPTAYGYKWAFVEE